MANLRFLKKEIDYRLEELVFDCDMTIYFRPDKEQVLSILKSTSHTEPQKEMALRKMPDSWSYLATNILPQMRYADIEFDYGVDEFVTRTTVVAPTEPAKPVQTSQPATQQPEMVVVDEEMGIIVATPRHDYDDDGDNKRNQRKARKADKKNIKGGYEAIYW